MKFLTRSFVAAAAAFACLHAGASTVLVSLNRGAMPQEMFLEQLRRFGAEVLPALQTHDVSGAAVGAAR